MKISEKSDLPLQFDRRQKERRARQPFGAQQDRGRCLIWTSGSTAFSPIYRGKHGAIPDGSSMAADTSVYGKKAKYFKTTADVFRCTVLWRTRDDSDEGNIKLWSFYIITKEESPPRARLLGRREADAGDRYWHSVEDETN